MERSSQSIVLINNSWPARPSQILMQKSSLDNLPQDTYIIFQEGADIFETAHKNLISLHVFQLKKYWTNSSDASKMAANPKHRKS